MFTCVRISGERDEDHRETKRKRGKKGRRGV